MKNLIIAILALVIADFAEAKIQKQGIKTAAECVADGATAATCLPEDTQIQVTANGLNKTLAAAITAGDIGGGGGGFKNFLTNPNFDPGNTTGWTASAGTLAATNTAANLYAGAYSGSWTPAASGNTLINTAFTITSGGGPSGSGGVKCQIKTAANDFVMSVLDGSNVLATQTLTGFSDYRPAVLTFVYPTSSTGINVKFTSAGTTPIYIDECFLGDGNVVNQTVAVQQASLVGTITISGCSAFWTTTSTSFTTSLSGSPTGCTYTASGAASNAGNSLPQIKFSSLQAGEYSLEYEGTLGPLTGAKNAYFQFTDGTNTAREISSMVGGGQQFQNGIKQSIVYNAPQTNVTLSISAKAVSGGETYIGGTTAQPGVIRVYRYPLASQIAVTPDLTAQSWTGKATGCEPSITSGSTIDFPSTSSCTMSTLASSNFPAVSFSATTPAQISFTPTKAGTYLVMADHHLQTGNGSGAVHLYLTDGSNNILANGRSYYHNAADYSSVPTSIITTISVPSLSTVTLKLRANSGSTGYVRLADDSGYLTWTIVNISQSLPMPVIVNSVSTPYNGQAKKLTATLNCDSSSVITSQDGTTALGVASIGNISAGVCAVTFAGMGSNTPRCQANKLGATKDLAVSINPTSATAANLYCVKASDGSDGTTCDADIECTFNQ